MANIEPFKFWAQKVLPAVYDDSLSYYEVLCKVVEKLNEVITNENSLNLDMQTLNNSFIILKDYVDNYFDNLDVQEEINKKLDEMAESGQLEPLFDALGNELRYYNAETRTLLNEELADTTEDLESYNEETRRLLTGELNTAIDNLRNMIASPVIVTDSSTTSGWDTDYVYVYVGETTESLTNGHWYYYGGATWEDGGTFNAVAFTTDKTLTQENEAADAKAVRTAISAGYLATDETVLGDIINPVWTAGYYISNSVASYGKVLATSESTQVSATLDLIRVPLGATLKIHSAANTRIAMYDKNGACTDVTSYPAIFDAEIDSDDAAYIRLQYPSRDTSTTQCIVQIQYNSGKLTHDNEFGGAVLNSTNATVSGYGNPVVLENTSNDKFENLSITPAGENSVLHLTGKNIVNFYDYEIMGAISPYVGSFTSNNVTFIFYPYSGEINIKTIYAPANANPRSANSSLGEKYSTVNGNLFYHNFKFKFKTDTYVTLTPNCSEPVDNLSPVQMRVTWDNGTHYYCVSENGLTFKATANREYAIYFLVRQGWFGDLTFKPQIEIGTHPTEFERFVGCDIDVGDDTSNLFSVDASGLRRDSNYLAVFNPTDDSIYLNCSKHTGMRAVVAPSKSTTLNGNTFYYINSFDGDGSWVLIGGIEKRFNGLLSGQITSNGTQFYYDRGDGLYFKTEANKTYYYRILAYANAELTTTIKPYIVQGEAALSYLRSRANKTILYTEDSSTIGSNVSPVIAHQIDRNEMISESYNIAKSIDVLTGGKLNANKENAKPIVSFIDDDATNEDFVAEYYNIFNSLNTATVVDSVDDMVDDKKVYVYSGHWYQWDGSQWADGGVYNSPKHLVGGYAIETDHIDDDNSGNLKRLLLNYEEDGFACLYHCKYQQSYTYMNASSMDDMTNHNYIYVYNGYRYKWNSSSEQWENIGQYTGKQIPPEGIENTWYFVDGADGDVRATGSDYSESKSRSNFVTGLRRMMTYGFANYNYWVTPYGVNNEFMKNMAKNYGMKCLISYPSRVYDYVSYVTRNANVSKWDIPRLHYGWYTEASTTNYDTRTREIANSCINDKGWLIVTTHVNDWPTDSSDRLTLTCRFRKLIMDLVNLGMDVVPFATGFETFRPYLDITDIVDE